MPRMNYEKRNARLWQQSNPYDSLQAAIDSDSSDDDYGEPQGPKEVAASPVPKSLQLPGVPFLPKKTPAVARHPRIVPPTSRLAHVHRPLRVAFFDKKDNTARAAFRQGLPPTKKFILSKPSYEIESDRKKLYITLEEIGVRLGSFIRPPQNFLDRELLLWGDERQTTNTWRELQNWVLKSEEPSKYNRDSAASLRGKDKFVKAMSTLNPKFEAEDKKLKKEAKLYKYQQQPAAGVSFEYTGYFLWPEDEVHAQELLGQSCEAFDPIRMHCRAHIIFESQLSLFKILSNDHAAIQNTIKRIESTMREFVARNGKSISRYLIDSPTPAAMQKEIKMLAGPSLTQTGSATMLPALTGGNLGLDELKVWFKASQELAAWNKHQMQHALQRSMARLPYYRGRVQMRVLFGTFALTVFRWPKETESIPFERFREDMELSNSKGTLIRNLNLKISAEEIIAHCLQVTDVLLPVHAHSITLEDNIPIHTARYNFRLPDVGPVRFDLEMNIPPGLDMYETYRKQWTRSPNEADLSAQRSLLELHMVRLQEGISWKLHIANENLVDTSRITPQMTAFADSVRFRHKPNAQFTGHKLFFHSSALPIESMEQKTALRFRLQSHPAWIFEIARYDSYAVNASLPTATQWGATLWNGQWDGTLAENAGLSIGQAAGWEPRLKTFFGRGSGGEDGGLEDFMKNLQAILGVLDGLKGTGAGIGSAVAAAEDMT